MLTFSYGGGLFKIQRDGVTIGQGRTLEQALLNTLGDDISEHGFDEHDIFITGEILTHLFGPLKSTHGQISTREA